MSLVVHLAVAALLAPADAARLQQAGAELFKAGRLEEAAAAFEAAYAADPHPTHLLNLAHAHSRREGGCGPALAAFERYFQACAATPCELLSVAQARQAALQTACYADVALRSTPTGASVVLDGQPAGATPLSLRLLVDVPHTAVLRAPDHHPVERSFKPHPGERLELEVALKPLPPPTASAARPTPPPPERSSVLGWSLLGAGVLALGAGVVFTGAAAETVEASEALDPGQRARYAELEDELLGEQVGMWLGFGLGAGLLAVGGWWLLDTPEPAPVGVRVGPGGLVLEGSW